MPNNAVEWWSTTLPAQSAAGSSADLHLASFFWSLLLVLALIVLLAWGFQRMRGASKDRQTEPEEKERVLAYSQFNSRQTLVVSESQGKLHCFVCQGRKLEAALEVACPAAAEREKKPAWRLAGGKAGQEATFQSLWLKLIGWRGNKP